MREYRQEEDDGMRNAKSLIINELEVDMKTGMGLSHAEVIRRIMAA